MTESKPPEGNLAAEFHKLGKNLAEVMRSAWENPERKKLQQEIESGLAELGAAVKKEVDSFSESPTGQRLKSDVQDVAQRVRSGEAEIKVREELLKALRTANAELQKVTENWSSDKSASKQTGTETGAGSAPSSEKGQTGATSPEQHNEVHPDDVDSTGPWQGHVEIHPDDVESDSTPNPS